MPYANETKTLEMPMVGYSYVPIQQAEMRNLFDPEYGLRSEEHTSELQSRI